MKYQREHINFRIFFETLNNYNVQIESDADESPVLNSGEVIGSIITFGVYQQNSEEIFSSLEADDEILFINQLIAKKEGYLIKNNNTRSLLGIVTQAHLNGEDVYIITVNDISEIYVERTEQYQQMILITLMLIAVTIISVSIILRKITAPLNVLTTASQEIAGGAYNKRTEINSKDEIGILSDNFDKMAQAVEEKIQSLEQEICAREDFVSNFSHELKTPMTSIMGYADMLRSYESDPETQIKAANYIYEESKQLNILSLKLMELMSLSEGHIEQISVDAQSLKINTSDDIVKQQFESATIIADKLLIQKVLSNLINNSKNAGANEIAVSGEIKDGNYIISVTDNGCGISEEEIQKITQPFYQTDKVRSKKSSGFGLGLALCEKILFAHGTKLKIESIPNRYTCMKFELKLNI